MSGRRDWLHNRVVSVGLIKITLEQIMKNVRKVIILSDRRLFLEETARATKVETHD